jgi:2-phospho-L-lactate guanylyltransferase
MRESLEVWGLVVVKRFEAAKSRLAGVLDGAGRRALARAMFERVMEALESSETVRAVAVLTDSAEVGALAAARGAIVISDPPDAETLAQKVDAGLAALEARGATAVLVLMSDLPEVTADDVRMLVAELAGSDVVVAADARGEHTNALGCRLAQRRPTAFGETDSFRRHCEAAARAGLTVAVPKSAGIAFDVDTPEDYAELLDRLRS